MMFPLIIIVISALLLLLGEAGKCGELMGARPFDAPSTVSLLNSFLFAIVLIGAIIYLATH